MKCSHCGSNLNIEDKYCPYCGEPNPFAVKHQKEMEHFSRDYDNTRREVLRNTSRLNKRNVRITVIAVLSALVLASFTVFLMSDRIKYQLEVMKAGKEKDNFTSAVEEFMDSKDYIGLDRYISQYVVFYNDIYAEYLPLTDAAGGFRNLYSDMTSILTYKSDPEGYTFLWSDDWPSDMADSIVRIYGATDSKLYNKESLDPERVAFIEEITSDMEVMLKGYFGFTDKEIKKLRTASKSKISTMIEEKLKDLPKGNPEGNDEN